MALVGCSGGLNSDDAAGPAEQSTTVSPPGTNFSGEGSEEFCGFIRNYSEPFDAITPTASPDELRTAFGEGQAQLGRAVAAAPSEIKRDVQEISDVFTALARTLELAQYDVTRLMPTALDGVQSPQFQESTKRLEAYVTRVCRLRR